MRLTITIDTETIEEDCQFGFAEDISSVIECHLERQYGAQAWINGTFQVDWMLDKRLRARKDGK